MKQSAHLKLSLVPGMVDMPGWYREAWMPPAMPTPMESVLPASLLLLAGLWLPPVPPCLPRAASTSASSLLDSRSRCLAAARAAAAAACWRRRRTHHTATAMAAMRAAPAWTIQELILKLSRSICVC